ncbi:MAG: c-type cytochrome biogenesis protein CcmI [Methylobacterium mesophilicum]|nr:c-type cytochrome biogenesis protein CcmI [Methylobacterium mesophilicum]
MFFWFIAALLTLGASLAVLLPLSSRAGKDEADGAYDIQVYRDQLAEIERDLVRGTISDSDAAEARAEIGRRILRADQDAKAENATVRFRASRLVAAAAVLFVPVFSWGVYAAVGSPDLPAEPLEARLSKPPAESSVDELVARAARRLSANPDDGPGWETIAPVYLRLDRFDEAQTAFAQAIRLLGSNASRELGSAEAMVGAAKGQISADAQAAYQRVLALDPQNARARFRLASAAAQEGRGEEAAKAWNALLASLPQGSPWRDATQQALAGLQQPAQPGPTQEQIAAAESMSASDRGQMVEGMVASLDRKLREEPNDMEGWLRLVRSYAVLGRSGDAGDALQRANAALKGNAEAEKQLARLAQSLNLPVGQP